MWSEVETMSSWHCFFAFIVSTDVMKWGLLKFNVILKFISLNINDIKRYFLDCNIYCIGMCCSSPELICARVDSFSVVNRFSVFMGPRGLFPCPEEPVASVQSTSPFWCSWLLCQCFKPIFYITHKLFCWNKCASKVLKKRGGRLHYSDVLWVAATSSENGLSTDECSLLTTCKQVRHFFVFSWK